MTIEQLKDRLREGDQTAAILLAREYAKMNKNKESCVCVLIAHKIAPTSITQKDLDRHSGLWGNLGGKARTMCTEKAGESVTAWLANKH